MCRLAMLPRTRRIARRPAVGTRGSVFSWQVVFGSAVPARRP